MSTSQPPDHPDDRPPVFPQELFDRLIDLLQIKSFQDPDLLNFSLVSKAWAHRSRKRIFNQVRLTSQTLFQLWCKNTAPGPGGPSSFVQVLILSQVNGKKWITPSNLLLGEKHLVSFTDLKGFIVYNLHTLHFKDRALLSQCFRVLGQDLRFLRLHHVKGTPQTVMSILQQFPKIRTLAIEYYTEADTVDEPSEEGIDEMNGRLQGCLRLLSIDTEGFGVIDSIARLPLGYEEVHLTSSLSFVQPYNRLFSACASTLQRLRIIDTRKPRTHWGVPIDCQGITVENCTELQMVRLGTSKKPGPMLERFLKSIDPSNICELAFELIWDKYEDDDIASVIDIPGWESIDDALCILARRIRESHSQRRLRVVLSVVTHQPADLGKVKMGSLFLKFRREGDISLQHFIDHLPPGLYSSDMPLLAMDGRR